MQRYKICQQFTTCNSVAFACFVLFQICKDTKFVSNSQLFVRNRTGRFYCFRYAKIQNLSAIHNVFGSCAPIKQLFQICKDTKFVSNSQQVRQPPFVFSYCFRYAKIQNLSAIHNKSAGQVRRHRNCFRYAKIQNLSAIHNYFRNMVSENLLFQICKDTKFVSNSQLHLSCRMEDLIVSDMQRYKICQQFTTGVNAVLAECRLFQICKDTKFVSNSQPFIRTDVVRWYCFRYAKIQNLSAIHN